MTIGALSRIRTTDRSRIRRVLYTTELKAHICHKRGSTQEWISYDVWHPEKDSHSHLTVLETVVLPLNYQGISVTKSPGCGGVPYDIWRSVRELNPCLPIDSRI